jgi:hypothetical protein
MVKRVRDWLDEGREVRIVTARVGPGVSLPDKGEQRKLIQDWCVKNLGKKLPVTASKDFEMIVLYDDRAVQVETNTGRIIEDHDTQEKT